MATDKELMDKWLQKNKPKKCKEAKEDRTQSNKNLRRFKKHFEKETEKAERDFTVKGGGIIVSRFRKTR